MSEVRRGALDAKRERKTSFDGYSAALGIRRPLLVAPNADAMPRNMGPFEGSRVSPSRAGVKAN